MNAAVITAVQSNDAVNASAIGARIRFAAVRFYNAAIAMADAYAVKAARRRADQRFLAMAQSDPRVMAELQAARLRAEDDSFDVPLTPMGIEAPAAPAKRPFAQAIAPISTVLNSRGRRVHLHYI